MNTGKVKTCKCALCAIDRFTDTGRPRENGKIEGMVRLYRYGRQPVRAPSRSSSVQNSTTLLGAKQRSCTRPSSVGNVAHNLWRPATLGVAAGPRGVMRRDGIRKVRDGCCVCRDRNSLVLHAVVPYANEYELSSILVISDISDAAPESAAKPRSFAATASDTRSTFDLWNGERY